MTKAEDDKTKIINWDFVTSRIPDFMLDPLEKVVEFLENTPLLSVDRDNLIRKIIEERKKLLAKQG